MNQNYYFASSQLRRRSPLFEHFPITVPALHLISSVLLLALIGPFLLSYIPHTKQASPPNLPVPNEVAASLPIPVSIESNTAVIARQAASPNAISAINAGRLISTQQLGKGRATHTAYTPDERLIVQATTIGLFFYDADTHEQIHQYDLNGWVRQLLFFENGAESYLIALTGQSLIQLNLADFSLRAEWKIDEYGLDDMVISPDGSFIAFSIQDVETYQRNQVRIWSFADTGMTRTFTVPSDTDIDSLAFTEDGKKLIAATNDTLAIWSVGSGNLMASQMPYARSERFLTEADGVVDRSTILSIESHDFEALSLSPNGIIGAGMGRDDSLHLVRLADGEVIETLVEAGAMENASFRNIIFSQDGRWVTTVHGENRVSLWSIEDGIVQREVPVAEDSISHLGFSTDANQLLIQYDTGFAQIWSVNSGQVTELGNHSFASIRGVAFAPHDHTFVTAHAHGTVRVWSLDSMTEIGNQQMSLKNIDSVAISPDGSSLATAMSEVTGTNSWHDRVSLWNLRDLSHQQSFEEPSDRVAGCGIFRNTVAFSPDNRLMASGSYFHPVRLWQVEEGVLVHSLEHHRLSVLDLAFSPDGRWLASASTDGQVLIWDVGSGEVAQVLEPHLGGAVSVTFSPDGEQVATAGATGEVFLWNLQSGKVVRALDEAVNTMTNLAFSLDGTVIVAGTNDNTAKVWSVASGKVLMTLNGHTGYVNSVDFSADGSTLATGSNDGTVQLWEVNF